MYKYLLVIGTVMSISLLSTMCWSGDRESPSRVKPPGAEESTKTEVLSGGAKLLQTHSPLTAFDVYLVGFHPMKDDPSHQMEAHHFCKVVNDDFMQCVLFDGNSSNANLNGIEYIISEKLFKTLPADEKQYWHPHNYEILSGELVAPRLPEAAEHVLMKTKVNSYGKTWHLWNTGAYGQSGDKLPLGRPMLAWSFNHDGEAQPGLVESRDKAMGINSGKVRQERQDLVPLTQPQMGVDALKGKFSGPTQSIVGVENESSSGGSQQ